MANVLVKQPLALARAPPCHSPQSEATSVHCTVAVVGPYSHQERGAIEDKLLHKKLS